MKTCLVIGLALITGFIGRALWRAHANSAEETDRHETTASSPTPIIVTDQATEEKKSISEKVALLLRNRDYRGLNLLAAQLRTRNETFPRGTLPIAFFFSGFEDLPKNATASDWDLHIQAVREWLTEDPGSSTARVALAQALFGYAWKARGHSFANDVKEEGWRLFTERVTEARGILAGAEGVEGKDQIFLAMRLRIALVDGTSRQQYDRLFEEAIRAFPAYPRFSMIRTNYLLPRWHGKPGEWEAFTAAFADRIGGEEGDILYAQVVWNMHEARKYENFFDDTTVEWPRTQRGFEALCRRYPGSVSALSEYCRLSGSAGAREVSKNLFIRLGNRVDLSVWDTTETWTQARRWAFFTE